MISHGPSSKTNLTIPDSIHIMVKSGRTICIFYSHYYSHYIIPLPPVNWNRPCQIGVGRWICTKTWTILTVSMWITQMVTHLTLFNWLWINTYTMFTGWWTSIKKKTAIEWCSQKGYKLTWLIPLWSPDEVRRTDARDLQSHHHARGPPRRLGVLAVLARTVASSKPWVMLHVYI